MIGRHVEWNSLQMPSEAQDLMKDLTKRISKVVSLLGEWRALDYTGHFIDVEGEARERIKQTADKTVACLAEWNIKIGE